MPDSTHSAKKWDGGNFPIISSSTTQSCMRIISTKASIVLSGAAAPEILMPGKPAGPAIPLSMPACGQLWQTGWMHNRVRMIVASFLIKHLLIDWRDRGEMVLGYACRCRSRPAMPRAGNGLQGAGADASPYFRIFNPILQGEKFDPRGNYVRRVRSWSLKICRINICTNHGPHLADRP